LQFGPALDVVAQVRDNRVLLTALTHITELAAGGASVRTAFQSGLRAPVADGGGILLWHPKPQKGANSYFIVICPAMVTNGGATIPASPIQMKQK